MAYPTSVRLREVSPRDGLQTIREGLPTAKKIQMIDALSRTGLSVIEAASFVSPKWVPQMADGEAVMEGIARVPGVHYTALVPNLTGYRRALASRADEIVLFLSASETYAQKNTNKSVAQSVEALEEIAHLAKVEKVPASVDISMAFGCPYEGAINPDDVVTLVGQCAALGLNEVYLADTTGTGDPLHVNALLARVLHDFPNVVFGLHLHDTRGLALANVVAALELGVDRFDCAAGGIGGGPYAEGATGNVATEDLVYLLESMGIDTGVDLHKLLEAGHLMESLLERQLASKLLRAGLPKGWKEIS